MRQFFAFLRRDHWTGCEIDAESFDAMRDRAAAIVLASPAMRRTEIMWWHAMSGELGRQLEKLAADFNASQSDYRIVPSYKGNYTETVTAAIFAFRSRSQPAIVQVNEIATATMMAAQRRDLSGVRIDARSVGAVFAGRLSACRDRLLRRRRRQHAVVPVQCLDADPLLQQGPVPRRRPRSRGRAEDLARGRRCGEAAARGGRGLRLHHVLAVLDQCREFLRLSQSADLDQRPTASAGSTRSSPSTIR